jgi:LPXTG-site transpeptidase (sortase) family protein
MALRPALFTLALTLGLAFVSGGFASPPRVGTRLGVLTIPRLNLSTPVEQCGLDCFTKAWPPELTSGPGHYPGTRLPWQSGLSVLSGHRTTYTHPFRWINKLQRGDRIIWTIHHVHYVYRVTGMRIVQPRGFGTLGLRAVEVPGGWTLTPRSNTGHRLTLVACHPPHYASHRIAVMATLVAERPV